MLSPDEWSQDVLLPPTPKGEPQGRDFSWLNREMCPFIHTARRDGCSPSLATSSAKSLGPLLLCRVLIRGPITVQGQLGLHTGSRSNWREPISSFLEVGGCSLSIISLATCRAHLDCCVHICAALTRLMGSSRYWHGESGEGSTSATVE